MTTTTTPFNLFYYRYARAGKEITILRSIYTDRKPSHRKPSHAKEKTLQTVLRVYAYTLRSQRNHSLRPMLAAYQNFSRFSSLSLKIGLILCFGKSRAFQPAKRKGYVICHHNEFIFPLFWPTYPCDFSNRPVCL
jgi:hypothetical protein